MTVLRRRGLRTTLTGGRLAEAPAGLADQALFEFLVGSCLWTATGGHGDWNARHTVWRSG